MRNGPPCKGLPARWPPRRGSTRPAPSGKGNASLAVIARHRLGARCYHAIHPRRAAKQSVPTFCTPRAGPQRVYGDLSGRRFCGVRGAKPQAGAGASGPSRRGLAAHVPARPPDALWHRRKHAAPRMSLAPHPRLQKPAGPVVLCICDGFGVGRCPEADAIAAAHTPNLDALKARHPHTRLFAHGPWVGLPSEDDMGNSEVGHNAIGCGRIVSQGAKLVNQAIESGSMFAPGSTWAEAVSHCTSSGGALHFAGLLSDGNVHSHIRHLLAMLDKAAEQGVAKARVHALFDGRDVGETSAPQYIAQLEEALERHRAAGLDYRVASGGGRMITTMDRYRANWAIVQRGFYAHVYGHSVNGNYAKSCLEAYNALRAKRGDVDQNLEEFVVVDADGKPVGPVAPGDSFIFFNFRGDRAIEISTAMDALAAGRASPEAKAFTFFDLACPCGSPAPENVYYAGMMLYDGDLGIPRHYLVAPPSIDNTLDEHLCRSGVNCYAISETQKYGHVTYFFNGNRSGKFDERLDHYVEVPSDRIEFSQAPWMKAGEITTEVEKAVASGQYQFIRLNYANTDMVGHCGDFEMARVAAECVDVCLGRLSRAVEQAHGVLIVIADHGNSDEMYEVAKRPDGSYAVKLDKAGKKVVKTSHSLNPVPCIVCDYSTPFLARARAEGAAEGVPAGASARPLPYTVDTATPMGLSSVAATCLAFLGFEKPAGYDEGVLRF